MALIHGTTTITVLKHGTANITTGKHGSTTVFTASANPLTVAPFEADWSPSAPFYILVANENDVDAILQIKGWLDNGTSMWESSDWVDVGTIYAMDSDYFYDQTFGMQEAELIGCQVDMRFKYTSGGTTYYSPEYQFEA